MKTGIPSSPYIVSERLLTVLSIWEKYQNIHSCNAKFISYFKEKFYIMICLIKNATNMHGLYILYLKPYYMDKQCKQSRNLSGYNQDT